MDELAVTDIDPDMRQLRGVRILEEDQITWLNICSRNGRARGYLGPDLKANIHPTSVLNNPVSKAWGIKRGRTMGVPDVRIPQVTERIRYHFARRTYGRSTYWTQIIGSFSEILG